MDFPNSVTLKNLEKTYDGYSNYSQLLSTIDDLVIGGNRIKQVASKYIKSIPGEDKAVYKKRLEKFTYENVIGGAVSELTRKFSTGTVNVLGMPESDKSVFHSFWKSFRNDLTRSNCNERKFIEKIFQCLVNYGKIYLHLEQDGISTGNVAQDLILGITPYINIYHPLSVLNQGIFEDEKWYKIKFQSNYETPFNDTGVSLKQISWLYISDTTIAEYKDIFAVSKNGEITGVLRGNEVINVTPDFNVTLTNPGIIKHGQNSNPIIEYRLEDQYWLTNNAYLRQLEHLRELNSKHDINTMLYIQRTFKPREKQQEDLEYITDEVENGIQSGNPYILDVESFSFNEPSGSSSTTLLNSLENTTTEIRSIFGLGPKETTKNALERSGASKEMDFLSCKDILENIGINVVSILDTVYEKTAFIIGYNDDIIVTGLDNFNVSLLSNDLDHAIKIQEIETSISPTALTIAYQRISHELAPSATPDQKMMIDKEVENIFSASIGLSRQEKEKKEN